MGNERLIEQSKHIVVMLDLLIRVGQALQHHGQDVVLCESVIIENSGAPPAEYHFAEHDVKAFVQPDLLL